MANRRPLRGAFIIPPPQGAVTDFVRTGAFESRYLTETELDYLTRHVDHCLYSYRATQFHSDFFLCQKK